MVDLCHKCGMPLGDTTLYIDGRVYHKECSPYAASPTPSLPEDVARLAAETERDRLAAELERKVAVAKEALEKMAALYESEYDADAPFNRPDWLRAALASLEDRA